MNNRQDSSSRRGVRHCNVFIVVLSDLWCWCCPSKPESWILEKKKGTVSITLPQMKNIEFQNFESYTRRPRILDSKFLVYIIKIKIKILWFYTSLFITTEENITQLTNIALSLSQVKHVEIYTDGSMNTKNDLSTTQMGFGWIINQPPNQTLTSSRQFPSSTKAEALAICTAFAVCPKHRDRHIIYWFTMLY